MYHYAGNNPVRYVDPDGREVAFCVVTAAVGAGIGAAYGAIKSYNATGSVDWKEVGKNALIGGAIGLGVGVTASLASTALIGATKATATSYEISAAVTTYVSANPSIRNTHAIIGSKLDYLFGKAQGNRHTIDRTLSMQRSLEKIGLGDSKNSRAYLIKELNKVLNDPSNIKEIQETGRVVRESLLTGPDGIIKMQTVWEDTKLITIELFGNN